MTEREVFKNYDNLSENELNSDNHKEVSVRNDVITSAIVHCRCEKRGKKQMNSGKNSVYKIWYNVTQ